MTAIYILKLRGGKYYVGKSDNVQKRFEQHLEGKGSAWTKKYSPIKIERTIPNSSPFEEDRYVKEYMAKYGVENVRGGTYTQFVLSSETIKHLQQEIRGTSDKCFKCGNSGHFANRCDADNESDEESEDEVGTVEATVEEESEDEVTREHVIHDTNETKNEEEENEVEEEENEVEEEVFEIEIDDVTYFATDEENGILYEATSDGDIGKKVGIIKNGEPIFS
jgi:predicted GIY-YIG superfamily endonuclease